MSKRCELRLCASCSAWPENLKTFWALTETFPSKPLRQKFVMIMKLQF